MNLIFITTSVFFIVQVGVLFAVNESCTLGNISGVVPNLVGNFSVNVDIIDVILKNATSMRYYQMGDVSGKIAVYHRHRDSETIFLVSSNKLAFINGSRCEVQEKKASKMAPLIIDPTFDRSNSAIFTLTDLFAKLSSIKFNVGASDQNSSYKRYVACDNKNSTWIKYSVKLPNFNYSQLPVSTIPSEIRIEIFNVTNSTLTTLTGDYIFHVSQYSNSLVGSHSDEMKLLPPLGIRCAEFSENKPKVLPVFPGRFSIKSEYIDYNESFVVHNEMFMDSSNGLLKFTYQRILPHQPLASTAPRPNLPIGAYYVVHDLTTGLQYVVSSTNDSCLNVSAIPKSSGDVELVNNKTIKLKTPYEILIGDQKINFSYVGQRFANDMLADVHVASVDQAGETFSYEMWIYNKTGQDSQNDVILSLRVYRQESASVPSLLSQQTFYQLKSQEKVWPQNSINVRTCLNLVQNFSYLLVQLTSDHEVHHIDTVELENQLRLKLAQMANVSLIRVTNFYFQPINKTSCFAFFQLADQSHVNGTVTSIFEPEIDLKQAHENLNRSLNAGDLKLNVQGVQIWATKDALNFVPPYFSGLNGTTNAIVQKSGYSGGSMAALAFFMLVIGSVGGFGLAFFLWKRNRGIQYQIYE